MTQSHVFPRISPLIEKKKKIKTNGEEKERVESEREQESEKSINHWPVCVCESRVTEVGSPGINNCEETND